MKDHLISSGALHKRHVMQALPPLLIRLWRHISRRRQIQYMLVLLMMIVASFAEIVTIGSVIPFLVALTSPEKLMSSPLGRQYLDAIGITTPQTLVLVLTVAVGLFGAFAGALRVGLLRVSTQLSCATGADISIEIYRRTLYQPYLVHVSRNSSEVVAGITLKTNHVIGSVFGPLLTLVSSAFTTLAVVGLLVTVDYQVAFTAMASFAMLYIIAAILTIKRVAASSNQIAVELDRTVKLLNEGLGGIRDVLIDGNQETYCEEFHSSDLRMRRAQASLLFISQCPRYLIEAGGIFLIAVIAYFLSTKDGGLLGALPVLGALALGAQRLLPLMQQAYSAWTIVRGSHSQLRATLDLLDQPLPKNMRSERNKSFTFTDAICLEQISFRYEDAGPWILRNVSLQIPKGSRVGFIGKTGSGKSTLLDLVMGLLPPTLGNIKIDGRVIAAVNMSDWQALIAHVPQSIFLADRSISENIAFGQPRLNIDMERVKEAARQAQIGELIASWPSGYDTVIGERGVRLSGGQRQRIGIARALYKRAEVIIFDEATSALDSDTEESVMNAIKGLGSSLTVLIIAHRLSTLSMCNKVVELGNEGILRVGSYAEIVERKQT
jgi:ATP-binding cassette, subfamily B, bacterial PglK